MPSDAQPRWAWLRSQGLGVLCGQLTVALLGVGSVVIPATRDGASAEVHFDDVTAFFSRPSWVHAWFYALLGVLALYALNTALCTWDSLRAKLARRVREAGAYAPAIIHLSFLLTLVAHLVGGLWTREHEPVTITASWVDVGGGRQARLLSVVEESLKNGRPKSVEATLEFKDAAGRVTARTLGYNAPLSDGLATELLLLEQAGRLPGALVFSLGASQCSARRETPCVLGGRTLQVLEVYEGERPAALVRLTGPGGPEQLVLGEGSTRPLRSGEELRFAGMTLEPAVLVRGRTVPGMPWAAAAALVMAVGLVLMGRRWV